MIDGFQGAQAQPRGQLAGVEAIALLLSQAPGVLARIANHDLGHARRQQPVKPLGIRALFRGDVQGAPQSLNEIQQGRRLARNRDLHDQLPGGIQHGDADGRPMNL